MLGVLDPPRLFVTGQPTPTGLGLPSGTEPFLRVLNFQIPTPGQRCWTNYWQPCEVQTGDILEASWCSGVRNATTAWAAIRVDVVTATATNTDYAWMAPGSNYLTFEVSWDLVDNAYVPVIGGLFCTNVPAGSCDVTNPPPTRYDAGGDKNFNLLFPCTNAPGSGTVNIILHNTTNALMYNLVSSASQTDVDWQSEWLDWGATGATNTLVTVNTSGRGDTLFFWACAAWPTVAQLANSANAAAFVNGVTNTYGNTSTVAVEPLIYSLNMGYDGSDHYGVLWGMPDPAGGTDTDPFPGMKFAAQGVTSLTLDPSTRLNVTNIAMSLNPLTSVDLANCPHLQIAEFYSCNQLAAVSLTNCPNLYRACFEACNLSSIDYSGCPNLVDIRLARNHVTNIVLGSAGPKIRHFCIHSNPDLSPLDLSSLYSVQELWFKYCNQTGVLAPVSTNLWSVWAEDQWFESADFTGRDTMTYCSIYGNLLTNLVITGCTNLTYLDAHANRLGTNQFDSVLYALRDVCTNCTYADLSGNGYASSAGYAAAQTILNSRNITLKFDYPDSETNNVPGPNLTTDLTFVTKEANPNMRVQVTGVATVTWHWGSGETFTETITNGFSTRQAAAALSGTKTNYVRIAQPEALVGFGRTGNDGQGYIAYAQNLPAFTNLAYLWLWQDHLEGIDLTNCPSLKELHLAGNTNTFSTAQMDQAFIAVAGTITRTNSVEPPNDWKFFYPPGTGQGAPDFTIEAVSAARQALIDRKWTLSTWPSP